MIRGALRPTGYHIVRRSAGLGYIDAAATIAAAKKQQISVPQYVARLWNEEGWVEKVTQFILNTASFPPSPVIVEIGPGTGRFLEQIYSLLKPSRYEIYETNEGWARYLAATYPVERLPASGKDLSDTPDGSCDLVHAHFVFAYLPVVAAFRYFSEMCRILKPGGYAIFDAYLDDQCNLSTIEEWCRHSDVFQVVLPRQPVIEFFSKHGCQKLPSELDMKVFRGKSRYLIFRKS
jgi:SAM-dependent methyltransferase